MLQRAIECGLVRAIGAGEKKNQQRRQLQLAA